jgi:cell division protein FtsQ
MNMSERKLNIQRVRNTILWSFLLAGIAALLLFAVRRKANAGVEALVVTIETSDGENRLITEKEVKQLISVASGKSVTEKTIKSLNIRKLENKLNKDSRIERADFYFDSNNRLHVRIIQKQPLMRVLSEGRQPYFIDVKGRKIPVSRGCEVRVPVVTGIQDTFKKGFLTDARPSRLKEVFTLLDYARKDPFLYALIEQVHVQADSTHDLVIIPKIGREKIVFGGLADMEDKCDKLKIFYRDGLPRLGWNRYTKLNLKMTSQIVGTLADPSLATQVQPVRSDSLQAALQRQE